MLDPTWQSPYVPSSTERHANQRAVRQFAIRRSMALNVIVAVVVVALLVGVIWVVWLPAVAVAAGLLYGWSLRQSLARFERQGQTLGGLMLSQFTTSGTTKDRQRLITVLDRLAATFGADGVSSFIVDDAGYNAALVPDGSKYSLFVTNAMMRDFELIELEGVVAHCLARQRLGLLTRESVSCVANISAESRRSLAGSGGAYRADEVAAASIRYPLGLAGALRKCERQVLPEGSFFAGSTYDNWRWIWFDRFSGRGVADLGDLDDVELRARALEEW